MLIRRKPGPVPEVLYRVKRGLAGYVSYLAACEMNESFSEYILYEPTLRILTARGFTVKCECPCPGIEKSGRGDFKKLDFVVGGHQTRFAIEMKWARNSRPNVAGDIDKLRSYRKATPDSRAFLFVFGTKSAIEHVTLSAPGCREQGTGVYAEFSVTRYGCRNFEITDA